MCAWASVTSRLGIPESLLHQMVLWPFRGKPAPLVWLTRWVFILSPFHTHTSLSPVFLYSSLLALHHHVLFEEVNVYIRMWSLFLHPAFCFADILFFLAVTLAFLFSSSLSLSFFSFKDKYWQHVDLVSEEWYLLYWNGFMSCNEGVI